MKCVDGILVCRAASEGGMEAAGSLADQERAGREYARSHGIRLIREPFRLASRLSGERGRAMVAEVMECIQTYSGKAPLALLAATYSRLARDAADCAVIENLVDEGRVVLHLFCEGRTVSSDTEPGDRLVLAVEAATRKHAYMKRRFGAAQSVVRRKRRSACGTQAAR